jgi:hypothetical protein
MALWYQDRDCSFFSGFVFKTWSRSASSQIEFPCDLLHLQQFYLQTDKTLNCRLPDTGANMLPISPTAATAVPYSAQEASEA